MNNGIKLHKKEIKVFTDRIAELKAYSAGLEKRLIQVINQNREYLLKIQKLEKQQH